MSARQDNSRVVDATAEARSKDAGLSVTAKIDATIPEWGVSEYSALYPSASDERRFEAMWSDRRNDAVFDRNWTRHDLDIGPWKQRQASPGSCCAWIVRPLGPLFMSFVRHGNVVHYFRSMRALWYHFDEYCFFSGASVCCSPNPFAKFYVVNEAAA